MRVQATRRVKIRADSEHATVNTLELFFDLVFVFALTQVTAYMADNLTWHGLLRGVLIIGLLWWPGRATPGWPTWPVPANRR